LNHRRPWRFRSLAGDTLLDATTAGLQRAWRRLIKTHGIGIGLPLPSRYSCNEKNRRHLPLLGPSDDVLSRSRGADPRHGNLHYASGAWTYLPNSS